MTTTTFYAPGAAIPESGQRALIVEDQPEIGDLLAKILQPLGFQTFIAGDGIEAVRLAAAINPNVLTLDLNLPVKDGNSVLRDLAMNPDTSQIPVVVISAHTGQLRATGQVVGVLCKPFDIHEVAEAIALAAGL